MSATGGRVVRTPHEAHPYKVVLQHEHAQDSEHPVATMREGEALIRAESPKPPRADVSRDRYSLVD
jgi:hypothetical protein